MQNYLLLGDLFILILTADGIRASESEYLRNALKVRFNVFKDVPRTESEALGKNFTRVSDCESGTFRGRQYVLDGDVAVIPLYDVNGYIAGLQTAVPKGLDTDYPPVEQRPPFIADGQYYKLTAYFIHPAVICHGRSKQQFHRTGTGQDLYIQTGPDPETDLLEISEYEKETDWVKGLCFPKMGYHFFKQVSIDMRCEEFYPVALLYYDGHLQGFVWSLGTILNSTYVSYEYPEPGFFNELMEEVPKCLFSLRRSTLHVYFRDNIDKLTCEYTPSRSSVLTVPTLGHVAVYGLFLILNSVHTA